jgi:tyrosine-protein phosphatase SIW14
MTEESRHWYGCGGARTRGIWLMCTLVAVQLMAGGCAGSSKRVGNYDTVTAGVLERGAKPGDEGIDGLNERSIRTVVDLRHNPETTAREREHVEQLHMHYVNIRCRADRPDEEAMARFLAVVACPENRPVFVHCEHGRERTGTAAAVYRIVVQDWTAERAIAELREHEGISALFFPEIPAFLRRIDRRDMAARADALRAEVCATTTQPSSSR